MTPQQKQHESVGAIHPSNGLDSAPHADAVNAAEMFASSAADFSMPVERTANGRVVEKVMTTTEQIAFMSRIIVEFRRAAGSDTSESQIAKAALSAISQFTRATSQSDERL